MCSRHAEGKGAARGMFGWDSVRHEAFAEMFVKYLLTANAYALVDGALSGVRRALMDTYRFLSSNSAIALPDEVTGLFGALMEAEDMFDNGEMPLSALSPDALRMLFTRSGIVDVSRGDLERLASLLDVARDSQTILAGRAALASLDLDAVRADAERAYGSSVWARTRDAVARLGGVPFRAFMDALPDDVPQERRLALGRAVRGWLRDNRLEYKSAAAESAERGEQGEGEGRERGAAQEAGG